MDLPQTYSYKKGLLIYLLIEVRCHPRQTYSQLLSFSYYTHTHTQTHTYTCIRPCCTFRLYVLKCEAAFWMVCAEQNLGVSRFNGHFAVAER